MSFLKLRWNKFFQLVDEVTELLMWEFVVQQFHYQPREKNVRHHRFSPGIQTTTKKELSSINGVRSNTFRCTGTFLIHREPHRRHLLLNLRLAETRLSNFVVKRGEKKESKAGRSSKDEYRQK